jgi:hypothetical protein
MTAPNATTARVSGQSRHDLLRRTTAAVANLTGLTPFHKRSFDHQRFDRHL